MKQIFLLSILIVSAHFLKAQTVTCPQAPNSSLTFSNVVCLGANTGATDDDFLQYTVTSVTPASNIVNFPSGTMPATSSLFNQSVQFTTPSPNCAPISISYTLQDIQTFCSNSISIQVAPAPIPTLGEWAMIILSFLALISGAIFLRQNKTQKV